MGSVRHVHTGDMTVDELLFPGGFRSSEHDTLDFLKVTLGGHSKELAE